MVCKIKKGLISHFRPIIIIFSLIFSQLAFSLNDIAVSMVPRGKVIETFGRNFTVRTLSGSKITVEFYLDGKFKEASGKNLNQGDELEPGEGLICLSTAARKLNQSGTKPKGYWTLEEDKTMGWIYVLGDTIIDAKTGKILKNIIEDDHSIVSNQ
jgi:hypothetical protein